jgi:hypothetical protein
MDQARQIDGFQQRREPQVVVDYLAELAVHALAERTMTAANKHLPLSLLTTTFSTSFVRVAKLRDSATVEQARVSHTYFKVFTVSL